jgi:hypothetical protein
MLCLVDRIPEEVEWQTPLARFRAFIPWFVKWNIENLNS